MRTSIDKFLVLEDSIAMHDLIEIKTSKKEESMRELRINIEGLIKKFGNFKNKEIDLAIVVYISESRMKTQDVDNITKIVMDSIQRPHPRSKLYNEFSKRPYLLEDDSQVQRLLVYKMEKKDTSDKRVDTDSVAISFREHDPKKEMMLGGYTNSSGDKW